jgi:predicted RNase H-like HicB family nuclease
MIYCGSNEVEQIKIHPDNAPHESHYVSITKDKDEPKFSVTICCNVEWSWDFWYSKTNYDVVKYLIMDCVFAAETMEELVDMLDEAFEEYCLEITFDDDECCGDCERCENNYLN